MSLTIHAWKKCKRTKAKKDDSDVKDDFADEPEGDKQSDGEESDEKDDEGSMTANNFQGESFDISQTIYLESKDLADVLAGKTCCKENCHEENSALLHQRKDSRRKIGRCSQ